MTMFGAFGFFWYSGENLTKKEDFTPELLALFDSKSLSSDFDLLVKFSAGLVREQTTIYIQVMRNQNGINPIRRNQSQLRSKISSKQFLTTSEWEFLLVVWLFQLLSTSWQLFIALLNVDLERYKFIKLKENYSLEEFYWAKMSSIITIQVYLHLCALERIHRISPYVVMWPICCPLESR